MSRYTHIDSMVAAFVSILSGQGRIHFILLFTIKQGRGSFFLQGVYICLTSFKISNLVSVAA